MYGLVRRVRVGKVNNKHYEDLQKILDKINNTQDLIIASDKTGNHYLVNSETYRAGYIKEEIEKDYKKSTQKKLQEVNMKSQKIAQSLELDNRIHGYKENESYVLLKDH